MGGAPPNLDGDAARLGSSQICNMSSRKDYVFLAWAGFSDTIRLIASWASVRMLTRSGTIWHLGASSRAVASAAHSAS